MKLLREQSDPSLVESGRHKDGFYYIEGVFMQAEQKNRNGRIYERNVLEGAVEKYKNERVVAGRAVGELNHPEAPTINYDNVSHLILSLEWKGNDVIGKARILNTPKGQVAQGLIEGGVQLGVSSRGMGSLRTVEGVNYVADDFILNTVDIVDDPSAPNAFPDSFRESAEWELQAGGVWVKKGSGNKKRGTELSEDRRLRQMKKLLSNFI